MALAEPLTSRVFRSCSCSYKRGGAESTFATAASIISPKLIPTTSEIKLPKPAAAIVDRPKRTPARNGTKGRIVPSMRVLKGQQQQQGPSRVVWAHAPNVQSIWSPTKIMMKLSANPKPTNGRPLAHASVSS